jgi:hypothetical protein
MAEDAAYANALAGLRLVPCPKCGERDEVALARVRYLTLGAAWLTAGLGVTLSVLAPYASWLLLPGGLASGLLIWRAHRWKWASSQPPPFEFLTEDVKAPSTRRRRQGRQ